MATFNRDAQKTFTPFILRIWLNWKKNRLRSLLNILPGLCRCGSQDSGALACFYSCKGSTCDWFEGFTYFFRQTFWHFMNVSNNDIKYSELHEDQITLNGKYCRKPDHSKGLTYFLLWLCIWYLFFPLIRFSCMCSTSVDFKFLTVLLTSWVLHDNICCFKIRLLLSHILWDGHTTIFQTILQLIQSPAAKFWQGLQVAFGFCSKTWTMISTYVKWSSEVSYYLNVSPNVIIALVGDLQWHLVARCR